VTSLEPVERTPLCVRCGGVEENLGRIGALGLGVEEMVALGLAEPTTSPEAACS
jgi:hypothetical protein